VLKKDSKLILSDQDLNKVKKIHRGWQPESWLLSESIRILFNLSAASVSDNETQIFSRAYRITELSEQIAFLKGLFLYGNSHFILNYAKDAVRSNTQSLFTAVSKFNPYPADNFSEREWNNMILKAVSWNCSLQDIYGIDQRANASLMKMLCEYAREQKGAKRRASKDLWRCVGPFSDESALLVLEEMLNSTDIEEQYIAALALGTSPRIEAKNLLDSKPELVTKIKELDINWNNLKHIEC
tara:strand:- start:4226 stop:4948 length:723 start_codon:yes stop_codon:yes gene_type:complete